MGWFLKVRDPQYSVLALYEFSLMKFTRKRILFHWNHQEHLLIFTLLMLTLNYWFGCKLVNFFLIWISIKYLIKCKFIDASSVFLNFSLTYKNFYIWDFKYNVFFVRWKFQANLCSHFYFLFVQRSYSCNHNNISTLNLYSLWVALIFLIITILNFRIRAIYMHDTHLCLLIEVCFAFCTV